MITPLKRFTVPYVRDTATLSYDQVYIGGRAVESRIQAQPVVVGGGDARRPDVLVPSARRAAPPPRIDLGVRAQPPLPPAAPRARAEGHCAPACTRGEHLQFSSLSALPDGAGGKFCGHRETWTGTHRRGVWFHSCEWSGLHG